MMEQEKLLRRLQEASFAVNEATLYLDTHPADKTALDYYDSYRRLRKKLLDEYAARFGPLTADDVKIADQWTWVQTPWPWETED